MKPDRKSDPRPATLEGQSPATPPPSDLSSLLSSIRDLEQRERDLVSEKVAKCQAFWDSSLAIIGAHVQQLTDFGFERAAILKAIARPATAAHPKTNNGPTTFDGWFSTYRSSGIQHYIKQHPDLGAQLKADAVPPNQYPAHLPPDDLASIESVARTKASKKCPQVPA